jgi:hypothetical protein
MRNLEGSFVEDSYTSSRTTNSTYSHLAELAAGRVYPVGAAGMALQAVDSNLSPFGVSLDQSSFSKDAPRPGRTSCCVYGGSD